VDNDIATIEAQARRLERVYEQLEAELRQRGVRQRLQRPAGDNEWSAMQILGHMAEMIPYWLHHCQALIAATAPPLQFGRTLNAAERLAGVERGATGNPEEVMSWLKQEILIATETIRAMSAEERQKTGLHIRRGEMRVADILEDFVVAHAEEHLAQILEAIRA
jgi:uncharacterized damage-inducible protein DinB